MIYTINLPRPSDDLIQMVRKYAFERPINYSAMRWGEDQQPAGTNVAAGEFWVQPEVASLALQEYQHLFTNALIPAIGIIHNVKETPASYPPHSDNSRRTVGINFYTDLGGDDVRTIVYDKIDNDPINGHVLSYSELPPILQSVKTTNTEWFTLSTKHYHSIENIKTSRCMLSLSIMNMPFKIFEYKYKSLFSDPVA